MEDEDGEDRALLGGRREADSAVHGAPRALSALCDPSRLAHRLVVLSLMCFLGFGERGSAGADDRGIPGFALLPGLGSPLFPSVWSEVTFVPPSPGVQQLLPGDADEKETQIFLPESCAPESFRTLLGEFQSVTKSLFLPPQATPPIPQCFPLYSFRARIRFG